MLVVLKLSGEALGPQGGGFDLDGVGELVGQMAEVHSNGVSFGIVMGAGNLVRGRALKGSSVSRVTADYMGMTATILNALALSDLLGSAGVDNAILSALPADKVTEPYSPRAASKHLSDGRVLLLPGGLGHPGFTTDTAAVQRSVELGASRLLKATNVDGVYSADPKTDPTATRFDRLSYQEAISRNLKVMDQTAFSLAREAGLPITVFDLQEPGALVRAATGEKVGTFVE